MRGTTMAATVVASLALAAPAQADRVSDPRDMPAGVTDVKSVGIWHSGDELVLTVKYHEPVPETYSAELTARLGPNCSSGSGRLQAYLAWDHRYADLRLRDGSWYPRSGSQVPEFENYRTTVFRFRDAALRKQSWRCASEVVFETSRDGGPTYRDRIRSLGV